MRSRRSWFSTTKKKSWFTTLAACSKKWASEKRPSSSSNSCTGLIAITRMSQRKWMSTMAARDEESLKFRDQGQKFEVSAVAFEEEPGQRFQGCSATAESLQCRECSPCKLFRYPA